MYYKGLIYETRNKNTAVYDCHERFRCNNEGALIAINGITSNINKVIWLEIDRDDYAKIEQLVYEAVEYANSHDSRSIEYDDEYFEV